jgi:dipeptidyl aminopeptidase/acylaminoacyl peptidase
MKFGHFLAGLLLPSIGLAAITEPEARERLDQARATEQEIKETRVTREPRVFWPQGDGWIIAAPTGRLLVPDLVAIAPRNGEMRPLVDESKLVAALRQAGVGQPRIPLRLQDIVPTDSGFEFRHQDRWWRCDLPAVTIKSIDREPPAIALLPPGQRISRPDESGESIHFELHNHSNENLRLFWLNQRERKDYGQIPPGGRHRQKTYKGHRWLLQGPKGTEWGQFIAAADGVIRLTGPVTPVPPPEPREVSPDGGRRVEIRGRAILIHDIQSNETREVRPEIPEGARWESSTLDWSPDNRHFAVRFRVDAPAREIHIVESSPPDQVQPKLRSFGYNKPGDPIDGLAWRVFDAESASMRAGDDSLTPHPWRLDEGAWSSDGREFTFIHHQRGNQILRLLGIDAFTGRAREILGDRSDTFIDYSQKGWFQRLPSTNEILWASERDGWNHLYLHDATTGAVKNQITKGAWNVKKVEAVDVEKRQLLLRVVGFHPEQDPYHEHWIRVGFDGGRPVPLTAADGTHDVRISPDGRFLLASWSRVDHPPVLEIRRASDGKKIASFGPADLTTARNLGWSPPIRFSAPGRDGKTMIYGHITLPVGFDPANKYPVVENIYAGPHDAHVRKNFSLWDGNNSMAQLGFVVVSIDGMGTNWRGKAFHDMAWKNLMDAGLPDRIAWIKAAAATRPWMDLERVGIYGGSAGGQNALSALLHHGDFYKVAVADCGCHDNRMDKVWWNEAWMGWPVDESYARNSNVTHAAKLTGKLMLIVGELDSNVDPASTMQVVGALQKAGKDFEFIPVVGAGHGAAETPYGERRRAMFLMRHLLD